MTTPTRRRHGLGLRRLGPVGAPPGCRLIAVQLGGGESGSHKQPAAAAVAVAARRAGHRRITAGSCGAYGLALAVEAARAGLSASIVLPDHAPSRLRARLLRLGAEVHLTPGGYEAAVAASKALAVADGQRIADGNVDGPYAPAVMAALARIGGQLLDVLDEAPRAVWVPTGNGTTVTALAAAGAVPVAVTARGHNSILASWPSPTHRPLPAAAVATTPTRDPLVNYAALHGQTALDVLHARRGTVLGVDDDHLLDAQARLAAAGVPCSPAAAAGLAGLLTAAPDRHPAGVHAIVVTGR